MAAADSAALIAAHRFGLGEASLAVVGRDPAAWLMGQIGPADAQRGAMLASSLDALRAQAELAAARREAAASAPDTRLQAAERLRESVIADTRSRLATAATTERPFAERLALFWSNHFTVSTAKGAVRGLAGPFEREAIRPHVGGRFESLLQAAVTHAAMLRYLDNEQSAGPDSRVVRRLAQRTAAGEPQRITGLNENLAREVLELHTLGVNGGYVQADVTAFAALLTGWRAVPPRQLTAESTEAVRFDPAFHQPGAKTVLGRRYAEGPDALPALLRDLAQHPSTARFIATKLARHFGADEPPPALVERLRARFEASGGDLAAVCRTLIESPEAWAAGWPKLKTPEEFVVSSVRLLGLGAAAFQKVPDGGTATLGQRVQSAPSPAGWPDRADEWLGPDAVWKRVEWATRVAERTGRSADARAIAQSAFGSGGLGAASRRQIERAADGPQALALLLLAPEFQRR